MAEYGEWNRKNATLSDVTAKKEYGVDQAFVIKGIKSGKLEYRQGSVWGNPYFRILRAQLEKFIADELDKNYLAKVKAEDELKKIKRSISLLQKSLIGLQSRKKEIEELLGLPPAVEKKRKAKGKSAASLLLFVVTISSMLTASLQAQPKTEITQLSPELIVVQGGGGSSGIIIGSGAVVVIDTKMAGGADDLNALAKEKAGQKPIIVINTHCHRDHVQGNKFYKGSPVYIGGYEKPFLDRVIDSVNQPNKFVKDDHVIDIGSEKVLLFNLGRAHTTNDMVVYLPKHKVLFTGDLVSNKTNPYLIEESGSSVPLWIGVLDTIISRWGDCQIVTGHGDPGGIDVVRKMRQYFADMSEAAEDPAQAKALAEKYENWTKSPNRASPEKTIEYIRTHR